MELRARFQPEFVSTIAPFCFLGEPREPLSFLPAAVVGRVSSLQAWPGLTVASPACVTAAERPLPRH